MLFLPVALVSAGAAAMLNLWLAVRISQIRLSKNILLGDGGDPRLVARMRAQMNFVEYAPIVLILIALIELAQGTKGWLWAVSAAFVVGRIVHAFGMDGWRVGRMIGAVVTLLVTVGLGLYAAWLGYLGLDPLR
jgi:uncharacterized protein